MRWTEQLSEKYRVAIEKRTYLSSEDDSLLVGIPDVSVIPRRTDNASSIRSTSLSTLTEPIAVTLPKVEDVQERYLEVREIATGAVITAIEILSPREQAFWRRTTRLRTQALSGVSQFDSLNRNRLAARRTTAAHHRQSTVPLPYVG